MQRSRSSIKASVRSLLPRSLSVASVKRQENNSREGNVGPRRISIASTKSHENGWAGESFVTRTLSIASGKTQEKMSKVGSFRSRRKTIASAKSVRKRLKKSNILSRRFSNFSTASSTHVKEDVPKRSKSETRMRSFRKRVLPSRLSQASRKIGSRSSLKANGIVGIDNTTTREETLDERLEERHAVLQNLSSWTNTNSTAVQLVMKENWSDLLVHLSTTTGKNDIAKNCKASEHCGQNFLHLLCGFHPPLCVFKSVYQRNPCFARQRDDKLRYPIHIAASSGARPELIDFLLRKYAKAAQKQDCQGRLPLHYVCNNPLFEDTTDISVSRKKRAFNSVKIICNHAPLSVLGEDEDGATAVEYALANIGDKKIVGLLQDVSTMVRREMSKREKKEDTVDDCSLIND